MFRKQFAIKSNTNMKTSERKKLAGRLSNGLLGASDLFPAKAQAALLKLTTFTDSSVNVFSFDKVPMAFEVDDGTLYPTVYALWKAPELLPTLLIHENVLNFLERGADLMLPGVIRLTGGHEVPFPQFPKGAPIAIGTISSNGHVKGPVVVGRALMSSADMIGSGMQGKGVEVVHMYRDCLWELGPREHPPVTADISLAVLMQKMRVPMNEEDFPPLEGSAASKEAAALSKDATSPADQPASGKAEEEVAAKSLEAAEEGDEKEADDVTDEPPEQLLYRCFLAALIHRLTKQAQFPFDVGQFYSRCLLPCVPVGRRLDMKKTKYKKFSTFLTEVGQNADVWLVRIVQKAKGVDMIAEVNWAHPDLKSFTLTDEKITDDVDPSNSSASAASSVPQIVEGFSVTEPVLALLKSVDSSISKGDYLDLASTRALVTEYVKTRNLHHGKNVSLGDPVLAHLINSNAEQMPWNDMLQKILTRMTKTYRIVSADGRVTTRKGDLPKLTFKVETRSGNKKVTLVNNVIVYGIEPKDFARKIQIGVATSATVNQQAPQCEGPQVLIQGNQVDFVGRLLLEDYGLNKKFISGLELAPKKKK
uniref:SUI1 domain-containing protein n=1 Tax=Plectus sambesii TaxID=2011161 RepID=A0A914WBS9_9BILA